MNQTWVRNYVEKYLEKNECTIIEKNEGYTTVQLSVEADKDLTNRPYYWTFVERTGAEPEPLTLTFIFDKQKTEDGIRGEEIKFGSERLKQFFYSAKRRGRIVRLFEETQANYTYQRRREHSRLLYPWLAVNYKVEFISDKKKDRIISLGINLANGQMKDDFYTYLKNINLTPALPANITIEQPFLNFREAALQFEEWLLNEIQEENFQWVIDANQRLQEEIEQIEAYYQIQQHDAVNEESLEEENIDVEKEKRIEEIKWQYAPKVDVKPINFGIFYLK